MTSPFRPFRISTSLLEGMVGAGLLSEDAPVELLDGELCLVSPQGSRHRMATVRVRRALEAAFGDGHWVQDHSPVSAGPDSLPDPDVAVVHGPERYDTHPGPAEVVLVVELCETTHREAHAKARIYGQAGFREYWILDLPGRTLTVHTGSVPAGPGAVGYGTVVVLADDASVEVAGARLAVLDLLPPSGA